MQTPPNTPQGAATPASAPEPDGEKHSSSKGFNLSRWALQHVPLTRYLLIMLLVLGIGAYFQLGQDEDPPFTFRAMVVSAAWPGATAQQMAEQVTDKVERTLQDVPNADKIVSYSKPGEMLVILNLREDTRPQDVPQTWLAVRKKVGDMRASLPQGVLGPFYNDDFGDVYGVIYALQGEGYSYAELKEYADSVRQSLLRVKDVAKVELFGVQDEKLYIEISRSKLAQLGLDMNQVIAQLGQQNAVQSGGEVQAGADRVQVEVTGEFRQLDDVKAMPIRGPNGNQLKLGDIADIYRSYLDPAKTKVHFQGQPTVALGISMRKGGDVIALGKHLHEAVDKIAPTLPAGLSLENVQDQPKAVSTSVNEFVRVLIEAVVIVLAVSFVSLGMHIRKGKDPLWRRITLDPRPGLVVGITIPLLLCATFLAMWYWGIGLHKVSLGSLIIALGLLVDDAIIAVEMMVRKMEEGYDKLSAATAAYDITAKPMLTGTLITAAGFMPIGIAKSTTGEYTFAIFAVTVIALVISWVASVYFVPYLGTVFLKKPRHAPQESEGGEGGEHAMFDTPFYNRFRRTVSWCVEHRWLTIGATVLVFALGLFGMSRVQQQFFPDSNRTEILMDVWLPEGSSMAANEEVTRRIEQRMQAQDGIESVTSWIGSGVPRFYLPLDQIFPQSNVSQLILLPHNLADRDSLMKRLPTLLAQEFPEVRAAGALPGAVPRDGPGPQAAAHARQRGARQAGGIARYARRQRQLERVHQGAAPGGGPEQGACAGCEQPEHCPGHAHPAVGQYHRAVPRRRQAARHGAAPAGGRAPGRHRRGQCLCGLEQRPGHLAVADCQAQLCLGAGYSLAPGPGVCDHRARRCGRRPARPDGDAKALARSAKAAAGLGRQGPQPIPHRDCRCGGRERQGLGLHHGGHADHGVHRLHPADAAAAQL